MNFSFYFNVHLVLLFVNFLSIRCDHEEDLLKEDHHNPEMDDYQYDHHAILGRSQSEIFDKLSPAESKVKLGEIIDKMDLNHDGNIDLLELKSWISNVFATIIAEDVDAQWKDLNKDGVDKLDFQTYLSGAFKSGINDERMPLVKLEERRWAAADLDKDNLLNRTEMFRFLHPEEFKDMRPTLVQESLEEMDKNKDGYVDIDEYLKEIFPDGREAKEEWIRNERLNFGTDRDLNKDGYLDRDEIQRWILPESYDRAEVEASHIMYKAGAGTDLILTRQQILDRYYVFVGSSSSSSSSHSGHTHDDSLNREDL